MSTLRTLTTIILGAAGACAWQASAVAADPGTIVQDAQLPAVSGLNGKWEFDPGILTSGYDLRAAGSLSAPVGDRLGVQGDVFGSYGTGGWAYGGALHAFTRDPSSYLFGVTAGVVTVPGATLGAVGLESELYLDRVSLEGWAGYAALNYVDPAMLDKTGAFAMGDIAVYPTDDWRLAAGASYVLGDLSVHAGTEYLFRDLGAPLSATADVRYHTSGNYTFTVGLKGYFGGSDDKTLIDRQRQDDPDNAALDLFSAAGSQLYDRPAAAPYDPNTQAPYDEATCQIWALANHSPNETFHWNGTACVRVI